MRAHVLAAVIVIVGCGGSTVEPAADTTDGGTSDTGGEGGTSGVSRDQACTDALKAICGQYEKCLPLLVSAGFGDEAKCEERLKAGCVAGFDAPGNSSTPDRLDACAKALDKVATCDVLGGASTPECTPLPGTLADGAGCTDDGQCKSTWCAKNDEATCGKCVKLTAAGDPCFDTGKKSDGTEDKKCSRGLSCNASGTCVKAAAKGESCSATTPCALSLACFGSKCVDAGKAGAKCDSAGVTDPPCDFAQGVYCSPVDKVCKLFQYGKAGESCGLVGAEFKICTAGAKCSADGAMMGTCVAPAADGSACDLTKKIGCLAPAQCEGGVCKLPSAASCK
ncbi:MAG: hypothetical protein ACXWUG_10045 [Polyangiales bacterium]